MLPKVRPLASLSIVMLMLVTFSACAQAERASTAGTNPPPDTPKAYCSAFETISFAELEPGKVDDAGNQADTKVTVAQILAHNAVWFALCTSPIATAR